MAIIRISRPARVFVVFWLVGIVWMVSTYFANPVDPTLQGTDRYGTTYHGELQSILGVTAVELALSIAILRPWSYERSWGRALLTLLVFTPWILLWGALGLHAGPTTHAHTVWLLLYWIGLLCSTTSALASAGYARRAITSIRPDGRCS